MPATRAALASYLRVYEPLSAFDRESQAYWRRYVQDGRALSPDDGPARQRTAVIEALGPSWSRLPELGEEAYVLHSDRAVLVCPWNLRVRVAEAALEARDGVPRVLADAFVPPALAGLAQAVVSDWNAGQNGSPRLHERVSPWTVPARWFALFDSCEREVTVGSGRRRLRYRTPISNARRRAHRAWAVLRRTVGNEPVTEAVEECARWLEEFHSGSVVELDYGGLAQVLPEETLVTDDSADLVARALDALRRDDAEAATSAYEQLAERWRAIGCLQRSN